MGGYQNTLYIYTKDSGTNQNLVNYVLDEKQKAKNPQHIGPTLDEVSKNPESYVMHVSGHKSHPAFNGRHIFDGYQNGKPKWAKGKNHSIKMFWTGRSWDCFWGGYSPEAPIDTPVPPFDGYTKDQGENHIRVYYELEGYTKDDTQKEKAKAPISTEQFKGGVWTAHSNIDMCGQGDVKIIPDWEKKYSIKDLQNMVEKKGYSAISVSPNSESFKHAALKKFNYQLTPKHCKPQGYKCTIYIYNKDEINKGNPPAPISSEQVKG